MRDVLIKRKVYYFEELDENAQNFVIRQNNEIWQDIFEESVKNWIFENFKNSDLKFEYSLSGCQGDGFNFYGNIELSDILRKIKFSDFEKEILNEIEGYFSEGLEKEQNRRYCYSKTDWDDFGLDEILDEIEYIFGENPKAFKFDFEDYENLIKKIKDFLRDFFVDAENNFEEIGYEILYPEPQKLIKNGFFDEYEFFENGEIFNEEI